MLINTNPTNKQHLASPTMNLKSKLPKTGVTIFTKMSALAKQQKAINLGQGYPDYQPDSRLLQAVTDAMQAGHNQYAPMHGVPELRQAVTQKVQTQHGVHYDPDTEVTVTSGASEALTSTFQALVHTGDEVILLDPAYDLYAPAITLAGGTIVRVALNAPTPDEPAFTTNWPAVEAALTPKTRMLVLNFPHNPTGTVLRDADLDALDALLAAHPKVIIVSDEAYEHIVFDGEEQQSVIRRVALASRTVLISSFGKTLHATGWKIGYCCAPRAITEEIRKVHQFVVFSVSTPMQIGIANYLQATDALTPLSVFYQKKRDRLASGLRSTCLKPLKTGGTFFLLVSTEALQGDNEEELAVRLTHQAGVASIPVSAFYPDPAAPSANHRLLRLCFAKQDSTLDEAIERLQRLG